MRPEGAMGRQLSRSLLAVLIAALALEGLYVVAGLVYLNTSLASRTINRRPQKFQITWRLGWTLWPGWVTLHGVETRGRSKSAGWYARLDSVTARCHLSPLLDRTVHLASVRASGVDYRLRRDRTTGATAAVPASELPAIPEMLDLPRARLRPSGSAGQPGPPWTILADRIDCDVEQLWIDRFRLTGGMRVETNMRLVVRGPMEFSPIRVTMASGDLRAGENRIFGHLGLDVNATLHPFVPRSARGLAFFGYLSGRFVVRSDDASLAFLESYFNNATWLHLNSRAGRRIDLLLDHGRLRPGSTLEAANDAIDIEFLDRHFTGKGVLEGTVVETNGMAQSHVAVRLKEFQVAALGSAEPFARGRDVTLLGTRDAPDFSRRVTNLHVVLDLPEAQILDLRFYNRMIPPGSGFRLLSGSGTLGYHLEGSQEERSLHGEIDLAVKNVAAVFKSYPMRGSFRLRTRLRQASPREMLFDISGTRLDMSTRSPAWSGVVTFPRSKMRFLDPMRIDAAIRFAMQDTRPLVGMFDAFKDVPDWMEHFMIIQDVHGRATLGVRQDRVNVGDLEVTGKGLHALADLALGSDHPDGILYVRLHGFSIGIEMRQGGKDLKFIRPLHWFETERSRHASARTGTTR